MRSNRLNNLYILGNHLKAINRFVYPFKFTYNNVEVYVIYHRLDHTYNKYWTIRLSFINFSDRQNDFECYANKNSLDITYTILQKFFHLSTIGNSDIKDIFNSFYKHFNAHIPTHVSDITDPKLQKSAAEYIHKYDNEKDKIYLFDVRHTSGRTNFNNDKAAAMYPEIYHEFRNDYSLSFFFTADINKETPLKELIDKAIKRGYL